MTIFVKRKTEVVEGGTKKQRSSGSNLFDHSYNQLGGSEICTTCKIHVDSDQVCYLFPGNLSYTLIVISRWLKLVLLFLGFFHTHWPPVQLRDNLWRGYYGILPVTYHTVNIDVNSSRWCNVGSI
ncbi:hypothetical protein C1H46_034441 [Malus baccata]|uniref:Uncharacterized protein n=1 Tax=Malus baccata TaxID=106549 RepID=A0A540L0J1_MALBA|nr:hypothetical protein C1H46_034441 [Malus baccata]